MNCDGGCAQTKSAPKIEDDKNENLQPNAEPLKVGEDLPIPAPEWDAVEQIKSDDDDYECPEPPTLPVKDDGEWQWY